MQPSHEAGQARKLRKYRLPANTSSSAGTGKPNKDRLKTRSLKGVPIISTVG